MANNNNNKEPRDCPCKKVPLCLSSFTAAEYGDLHSLAKLGPAVANRRDEAGYTPLHLAAQNGHVAATSLLLQLGCPINGPGATPLHRASFSGAVATMRVLLLQSEESDCDILARDTSFGDEMTPLHKAAAGGRYLAVQLLLEVLREQTTSNTSRMVTTTTPSDAAKTSLLSQALQARDRYQRTPLDVAIELGQRQEEERRSVARWDQVARGVADWDKCVELLRAAEAGIRSQEDPKKSTIVQQTLMQLPDHLVRVNKDGCIDCGPSTADGRCLTASWQAAFQAALGNSVDLLLNDKPTAQQTRLNTSVNEPPTVVHRTTTVSKSPVAKVDAESTKATGSRSGLSCSLCGKLSVALYPMASGSLMCKACKRSGAA
jgi:hypothetical protein